MELSRCHHTSAADVSLYFPTHRQPVLIQLSVAAPNPPMTKNLNAFTLSSTGGPLRVGETEMSTSTAACTAEVRAIECFIEEDLVKRRE